MAISTLTIPRIHLNISKKHPTVSNPSEYIWIHPRCFNLLISMRTQFYCLWGTMEGFISGKVWYYVLFDSFWYLLLLFGLVGTPDYFLSHFFCSLGTMGRFILYVGESKRLSILGVFCYSEFRISPNQANNKFILGKIFHPHPTQSMM